MKRLVARLALTSLVCAALPTAAALLLHASSLGVAVSAALWVLLVALAAGVAMQWQALARLVQPLAALDRAAAGLARGEIAAPLEPPPAPELQTLVRSFNDLAERLKNARNGDEAFGERTHELERLNLELFGRNRELAASSEQLAQTRTREQSKGRALAALTSDAELSDMVGKALAEMAAPVGAVVMVCYQLEGQELVPIAHFAASEQARTTRLPLAGLAEQVLSRRQMQVVRELPDSLDLRYDVILSSGRPHWMAMLPLAVSNRPAGILAVGALSAPSEEALSTLADFTAPLALTIARRTLIEQTERIARQLAYTNEELRDQAEALAMQGEELKAQQRELELKNVEVQKADRLKSEFLANMSHELRTPLNAVIGFSELLLEEAPQLSETHRAYVQDIHVSGKHLLTLINRVLDLAKIESGHMTLTPEAVDPREALRDALTLLRPQAQKKQISITLVETRVPAVDADRGRLQQVLINLLANAVKFSPQSSTIEVGCEREEQEVWFWVRDEGPGVSAEIRERLFQPFFQAEGPLVKKHEGTGLGLAISRRLVEQMGGTIGITSEPGSGSIFWFTLPVAETLPLPQKQDEHPTTVPSCEGRVVLVVDDHALNRTLMRELLERRRCGVLLASDGDEAIRLAREQQPDLVLVDLAMPGRDGFQVGAALRDDPRTAHLPVVALTAMVIRAEDERLVRTGFEGVLPKPVQRSALDQILIRFFLEREAA